MLWVYFDFYRLTLDQIEVTAPAQQDTATVVYHAGNNQLIQVNRAAQQAGLKPGMGMAQAAALCAQLTIIDYQAEYETKRLTALANRLYQLAADIVLYEPNGLAVRLDTLVKYYDGLACIWAALSNELQEAAVNYHFASAWSIEAAIVLTNYKVNQLLHQPQAIKAALARCPLWATQVEPKQLQALKRVGINSLAELLNLPVTELGKRFDNKLISYLCALRAEIVPKRIAYHPPTTFCHQLTPSYEISDASRLTPWLETLLEEFLTYARLRNKRTSHLQFSLYFRDHPVQLLNIQSAMPLSQFSQWQSLLRLKLETLTLVAPVIQTQLNVVALEALTEQTSDFFSNRQHVFAQKHLISRLKTRLGETAVSTPVAGEDHRISHHLPHQPHSSTNLKHATPGICLLACKLLSEECHIEYGPVRIHAGWWDDDIQKRDYYIARTPTGQRLSIFKAHGGEWFVQGWYC